ncbi:putative transcriptional regulatory protein C3C7.04 [Ceratocystis fimbriata CBS 114723]|uniref:Putative transcriptional regulatory protein C3C7.04 n=1 Tax=Ceratocystis fimbriata CBS 114723 TaxID=1035309 RepID=A0A2C5X4N1_9PEZI|nr:putative transcriptional regulatory protein C3C7.04 [Ceratocystis fimbriata CBS 114723]
MPKMAPSHQPPQPARGVDSPGPGPGTNAGVSKSPSRTRDASFTACLTCRSKKVKCSGGNPCQYCSKRGLNCQATAPGQRRAYSVTRIQELESRLAEYERSTSIAPNVHAAPQPQPQPQPLASSVSQSASQTQASSQTPSQPLSQTQSRSRSQAQSRPQSQSRTPVQSQTHTPHANHAHLSVVQTPPQQQSKHNLLLAEVEKECPSRNDSPDSTIFADAALSSSHNFGSRVENIFNRRSTVCCSGPGSANSASGPHSGGPVTPLSTSTGGATDAAHAPRRPADFPVLPSEQEAFQLLDVTMLHLSHIQHHFDARLFADKLSAFYGAPPPPDPNYYTSPWVVEILLLLALGKLLSGTFEYEDEHGRTISEDLPGAEMFRYAHANMPNLSHMLSLEALGVELLALTAMYLQNSGRKEEAYVYISTALRLCLTHGYHMSSTKKPILQSERTHINRLWWTVYMQERRVAAATGQCSSIADEAIEIPLPSSAPGFFHPGGLCTTIKIARVTGHIMRVLYGPGLRTEEQFVPNVQEIVRQLYDISKEIPAELMADYHGVDPDVSFRTVASLHLMLYHTIILTIRPILLHVAQLILSGRGPKAEQLSTSPLGKLSRTCTEAARRSLRVLVALQKRDMMLSFGFFDSDALFSVAFILILAAVLDSQEPGVRINQSPGLDDAIGVMQHIVSRGNRNALERIQAVKRIWLKVSEYLEGQQAQNNNSSAGLDGAAAPQAEAAVDIADRAAAGPGAAAANGMPYDDIQQPQQPQQQGVESFFQEMPIHTDLLHDISHLWQAPVDLGQTGGVPEQTNMTIDDRSYFSLYMDQDWTLVGEGETDFAELSRQILEWS